MNPPVFSLLLTLCIWVWSSPFSASAQELPESHEQLCNDGQDNDGDMVYDCGDHDCANDPACQPDGNPENSEERCTDWVDNDRDGYTDCEDFDCNRMKVCQGSWDSQATTPTETATPTSDAISQKQAKSGVDPEDLIGQAGDNDGERSDYLCADGIDNDDDGRVDCDDIGCKLDIQVTVCQPQSDFHFSVVARIAQGYDFQEKKLSTEFDALQLRVLGQMPYIQNSFFLLSMRAEKTPRLTFAIFQVPIKNGHYVNINSGGGGLSLELVRSIHKRLLTDSAFYVYNAFEQGNGAALEFGGPFDKRGKFLYRTFVAGGTGRFSGNIGGTFFPDNNNNYTWSAGAQLHMNLVGYFNRFDSPMLYTPVPTTYTLTIGGKYDQRAQERYPAVNLQTVFRWKRIIALAEVYGKRELNFKNWQLAYNIQVGVLAWSKRLLLAADFGQYLATDFEQPPTTLGYDLRRQIQEMQYRVAAHVYIWRDVFLATLIFRDRRTEPTPSQEGVQVAQDLRFLLQYRF